MEKPRLRVDSFLRRLSPDSYQGSIAFHQPNSSVSFTYTINATPRATFRFIISIRRSCGKQIVYATFEMRPEASRKVVSPVLKNFREAGKKEIVVEIIHSLFFLGTQMWDDFDVVDVATGSVTDIDDPDIYSETLVEELERLRFVL